MGARKPGTTLSETLQKFLNTLIEHTKYDKIDDVIMSDVAVWPSVWPREII